MLGILLSIVYACSSTTISLTSDSLVVGALTSYNVVFDSHNSPAKIQTLFSEWSPNQQKPYQSLPTYYLLSDSSRIELSCKLKFGGSVFECTLPSAPDPLSITIDNIQNPSSTAAYELTFNLVNDTGSQSLTTTLTVSQLPNSQMQLDNYDQEVGASSTPTLYLNVDYYITTETILQLIYDTSYITWTFTPNSISGYQVLSHNSGTVLLTNWSNLALQTRALGELEVVNPEAALEYTVTATLYHNDTGARYDIQTYTLTTNILPTQFTAIQGTSQLQMGLSSQSITITSLACPYTPQDFSSTNKSYTLLTIGQIVSCTTIISQTSTTTCSYNSTPMTMESLTTSIDDSSLTLTITLYTYYQDYYPLCSSTHAITLVTQSIVPSFDVGLCAGGITGEDNLNTLLVVQVEGCSAGDIVTISGIQGEVLSPWAQSGSDYTYTIQSSDIVNSTHISLALPYSNPSYVSDTNNITTISISQTSTYAEYTGSLTVCSVNTAIQIPSIMISMEESTTFTLTNYDISFSTYFSDYDSDNSILVKFVGNQYALNAALSAEVNGVSKAVIVDAGNSELTILEAFAQTATLYNLSLTNIVNPASVCSTCEIQLSLLSQTDTIKEYASVGISYTTGSVAISQTPIPILSTAQLDLELTSSVRQAYYVGVSTQVEVEINFTCDAQNSTTWETGALSLSFTCQIPFITDSTITIIQTINGQLCTSSTHTLELECADSCYQCVGSSCTQCVNITHSSSIYLYDGSCYDVCPDGSYLSEGTTCLQCHITCSTCDDSGLGSCTNCLDNFQWGGDKCVSICGEGKYYDGQCKACDANCLHCLNGSYCYVCRDGATFIEEALCEFTVCQSPCDTCQTTNSTCLSCITEYFLYDTSCVSDCPEGTYTSGSNCIDIDIPVLYFPATITSVVLIILACVCNGFVTRNMTDHSRRHIQMLTYSSAILAYMELFAVLLVVVLTTSGNIVGYVGLGFSILANCLFAGYYCVVIRNDGNVVQVMEKMSSKAKCIYYLTLVLSFVVSLRTFRILYCGLFKGIAPYLMNKPDNAQNEEEQSHSDDEATVSKLSLKQPCIIYITFLSLIGSILFLVTAILEIVYFQYINMLIWGLDLLIVVVLSFIVTIIDMWAGIKRSYLMALEESSLPNQTQENLVENLAGQQQEAFEENKIEGQQATQQKFIHNVKATQKITRVANNAQASLSKNQGRKSVSPKKTSQSPPLERKRSSQKSNARSGAKSPNSPKSPKSLKKQQSKQKSPYKSGANVRQKSKVDKIRPSKNRYIDKRKQLQVQEESQIPDIKVFEDDQLHTGESGAIKAEKLKRLPRDQRKMLQSMNNIKKTQFAPQSTRMSWKVNDIFLGFANDKNLDSDEQKTVKFQIPHGFGRRNSDFEGSQDMRSFNSDPQNLQHFQEEKEQSKEQIKEQEVKVEDAGEEQQKEK